MAIQDQLLTTGMGGVLPEQPDPTIFHRLLDVGCGTGGWLLETAQTYPHMSLLIGIDVGNKFVEYARAQAAEQQVADRVAFHTMDALRVLEFPPASFDLINQRLGSSYLRTWEWSKLLREYQRVCRRGGTIRITESCVATESSSSAYIRFNQIILEALNHSGHFFTPEAEGVTNHLVHLLSQAGCQDIQSQTHQINCSAGTPQGQWFYEDSQYASRTLLPFLQKWTRVPEDYEQLCLQMLDEMQLPNFTATWKLLTVWGKNKGL